MRNAVAAFAGVSFLGTSGMTCCGVGLPALHALGTAECSYEAGCPLAVNGETVLVASDWGSTARIERVHLDDWTLAEIDVDGSRIIVRPHTPGSVEMRVVLGDGTELVRRLQFAELATTEISTTPSFGQTYPSGPNLFVGACLEVVAIHRDAAGTALLGHGLEDWAATNATLEATRVVDGDLGDAALVRSLCAPAPGPISVSARPGSKPFEAEVVPAGSTTILAISTSDRSVSQLRLGTVTARVGMPISFDVDAFGADRRVIHGMPRGVTVRARTSDPAIATVELFTHVRGFALVPRSPGTTELVVEFDGAKAPFIVEVH